LTVKIRNYFLWGLFVCLVGFGTLSALVERSDRNRDQIRIKEHIPVIAEALWNLDPAGAKEYLDLAARLDNNEQISISDASGQVFLHVEGLEPSFADKRLLSIGLITKHGMSEPILRDGQNIGELRIVHRHTSIYIHLYLLLVFGLILVAYFFFLRVHAAKKDLSDRVEARTAELMEANKKLFHSQKLEAVGQLAGGVAHDFNNLLMGISGNAELLQLDLEPGTLEAEYAENILTASFRAADLTRQLLDFSRKGKLRTLNVDLHLIVEEVVTLVERSVDKRIELLQQLEATHSLVVGDPSQLQSVILNLALNSRDAMPDGGTLTFSTRNLSIDQSYNLESFENLVPGRYLEISVSDTGVGMDEDLKNKIFEPFFTTKEQGKGSGLGLASVYGCVIDHNGMVDVYSEPGQGSAFKVLLPVATSEETEVSPNTQSLIQGQGHILVVDDDDSILQFSRDALTRMGYLVSLCSNGIDAVELFSERHTKIDLVILDQVMPKMSGEETFYRLKEIDPNVRVVLASGFAHNATVEGLIKNGVLGFLPKPFHIDDMAREIAQHLRRDKE